MRGVGDAHFRGALPQDSQRRAQNRVGGTQFENGLAVRFAVGRHLDPLNRQVPGVENQAVAGTFDV